MNQRLIAVGTGGVGAGFLGYLWYKKKKTPTAGSFQSLNTTAADGETIKISTPVPAYVTASQVTGQPATPPGAPPTVPHQPVPTSVPGVGVVYGPPTTITLTRSGQVAQPPPILVTHNGAASVAVGSLKDVQRSLNTLGWQPPLKVDGIIGPKTRAAVRAFQSSQHLVVDGIPGPATRAALSSALTQKAGSSSVIGSTVMYSAPETGQVTTPTGQTINTSRALTMGVQMIQHALNLAGATPRLVEDGKIGPKTIAAIKSFQTAHGLTPDGVAGPKTKTALYLAMNQG